jgi:hypothetical protein
VTGCHCIFSAINKFSVRRPGVIRPVLLHVFENLARANTVTVPRRKIYISLTVVDSKIFIFTSKTVPTIINMHGENNIHTQIFAKRFKTGTPVLD